MCGLFGVMGRGINLPIREAYKDLIYVSALRGQDSTGVLAWGEGMDPHVFKSVRTPSEFLDLYGGRTGFLSSNAFDLMMGHCRYTTVGKINHQNAHPFDVGRYIGCHNGTLESKSFVHKTKTDSEMMFLQMKNRGIKPVLDGMRGWDAYAVSIFDKQDKSVTLANNGKRSLGVAILKDHDAIFWASEYMMLHLALTRNRIRYDVFTLPKDTIYRLDLDLIKAGNESPWTVQKLKPAPKEDDDLRYQQWLGSNMSGSSDLNDAIPF